MKVKKKEAEIFSFCPFENLREIIKEKKVPLVTPPAPPPPAAVPHDPEEDRAAFREAMKDVREIRQFRRLPVRKKKIDSPAGKPRETDEKTLHCLSEIVSGRRSIPLPDTQEYVEWVNPGARADILRMLHAGRFSVQDYLDLHGFTMEEAEAEMDRFMKSAVRNKLRCVRIIHGRGLRSPAGPVLKKSVVHWLSRRYRKHIAAFVTARQCDGGLGAVYVLLK